MTAPMMARPAEPRTIGVALLLVCLVGTAIRLAFLGQPMRQDEADTVVLFAWTPVRHILVDTSIPNNHILHTLAVKLATALFGDAPAVVRLPAFIAGVATIPLTFLIGRRWFDSRAGLLAAATVAVSAPLVLYSTNARGYSMIGCATLVAALGLHEGLHHGTRRAWMLFSLALAAGAAVNPSMLYPAAGLGAWALLSLGRGGVPRDRWRSLVAWSVVAALLALAWYAPAIKVSGLRSIIANDYVKPMPWGPFVAAVARFAREFAGWTADGWLVTWTAVAAVSLVVGWWQHRRWARDPVSLSLVMLIVALLLLVVMRRAPFLRVWLFLLPVLAVTVGGAMAAWLQRLPRADVAVAATALAIAMGNGMALLTRDTVRQMPETGVIPDAQQVAGALMRELQPGDAVVALWRSQGPVDFYLRRAGVTASFVSDGATTPSGRVFIITSTAQKETPASVVSSRHLALPPGARFVALAEWPTATLHQVERAP